MFTINRRNTTAGEKRINESFLDQIENKFRELETKIKTLEGK